MEASGKQRSSGWFVINTALNADCFESSFHYFWFNPNFLSWSWTAPAGFLNPSSWWKPGSRAVGWWLCLDSGSSPTTRKPFFGGMCSITTTRKPFFGGTRFIASVRSRFLEGCVLSRPARPRQSVALQDDGAGLAGLAGFRIESGMTEGKWGNLGDIIIRGIYESSQFEFYPISGSGNEINDKLICQRFFRKEGCVSPSDIDVKYTGDRIQKAGDEIQEIEARRQCL